MVAINPSFSGLGWEKLVDLVENRLKDKGWARRHHVSIIPRLFG